jgi:hypothetical protein
MKRIGFLVAVPAAAAALLTAAVVPAASAATTSATSAASKPLPCHASMSNAKPSDYTDVYVNVATAAAAKITTVAHYKTTKTTHTGTANRKGDASIRYYISGATPSYKVVVSVKVASGKHTGSCSTSFVPHR